MPPDSNTKQAKRKKRDNGQGTLIPPREGITRFWTVQININGRTIRRSSKSETKTGAQLFLDDLKKQYANGVVTLTSDPTKLCYADLRRRYLKDYEESNNRSLLENQETGEKYVCGLNHLDKFFGYENANDRGVKVSTITVDRIGAFKDARKKEGAANGTINRSLAALRRMFNLMKNDGKLNTIPFVKLLPEPKQPREGFLEVQDYEKLQNNLPEYVRPAFAVGYYTGMRLDEILRLTWSMVNLEEGKPSINLPPHITKTNEARYIPIDVDGLPDLLEKIRQKTPEASGSDRVFLGETGKPIGSFIKAWRNACIKTAIKTKLNGMEVISHFSKGRGCCSYCDVNEIREGKYVGFLFHDLRRTAVRDLIRAGTPRSVAMKITGHVTESVFERYNITNTEDVEDAIDNLGTYREQKRAEAKKAAKRIKVVA